MKALNLIHGMEARIMRSAIGELLSHGFTLGVYDGEETTIHHSASALDVFAALRTTDDDYLIVYAAGDDGPRFGWVRFVYGNDGFDVIADNTTNLEPHLVATTALAESLEGAS